MDRSSEERRRYRWQVFGVLAVSGVLGFRVGAVGFPDWQVAVESAQVVAGLVEYPPENPFYIYHTKLWTVLHQVLAALLLSGVSEISLSVFVSGLMGMVSLQALSMVVYALAGDPLLAIGSAFLIFFGRMAEFGVVYPIWLMGTSHTYGVLGLSYVVLVAALLGAGCYRTGGILLGAAPAVHPSLGAWLMLVVALCSAWDFRRLRDDFRPGLPYFLAGCGLTLTSLVVQLALIADTPPIAGAAADRYFTALVVFWDAHRQPVRPSTDGVLLNIGSLTLAALWLRFFVGDLPRPAAFLLRFAAATAVLGLAFGALSWIPPDRLPRFFLIAMPPRLLNVNAMIFAALLLGLIGRYRHMRWGQLLLPLLIGGYLLVDRSWLWTRVAEGRAALPVDWLTPPVILVLGTVGLLVGRARWSRPAARPGPAGFAAARAVAATAARIATLAVLLWAGIMTWQITAPRVGLLLDRTNDLLFHVAAEATGTLATGGELHLVQLRTRRPVLLDGGGLDGLAYSLEAAPEMERILRDVYSIELLDPPEEARRAGMIPRGLGKTIWEGYSPEKWQTIARTYHVTQVLAYADWTLKLPVAARNRTFTLYDIPGFSAPESPVGSPAR